MKIKLVLVLLSFLFLVGCGGAISESEAEHIGREYILENYGPFNSGESLEFSQVVVSGDKLHAQYIIGDDKMTVIMTKSGKVLDDKTYEWV